MKNYMILLSSVNDVKNFVNTVMNYDFDLDLMSGRYAVDAKSIMGIFSLDISQPIKLVAHTDETEQLEKDLAKYFVD
ncbi:MAG: HPr family phosphocarrier protein [Porcipelethomonas sp.]